MMFRRRRDAQAALFPESTPAPTAGAFANRNGAQLEDTIENLLRGQGCRFMHHAEVGQTIFGTVLVADVVVAPGQLREFPDGVAIECKWQASAGSADEKLAYVCLNIERGRYPVPVIVVADGRGARPQAIAWLRQQVDRRRLAYVFDLVEFITWLNRQP